MQPGMFSQGEKFEKYFWSILDEKRHFLPTFSQFWQKLKNDQAGPKTTRSDHTGSMVHNIHNTATKAVGDLETFDCDFGIRKLLKCSPFAQMLQIMKITKYCNVFIVF